MEKKLQKMFVFSSLSRFAWIEYIYIKYDFASTQIFVTFDINVNNKCAQDFHSNVLFSHHLTFSCRYYFFVFWFIHLRAGNNKLFAYTILIKTKRHWIGIRYRDEWKKENDVIVCVYVWWRVFGVCMGMFCMFLLL